MSLSKIFRAPIKLFKKEVITFLIIRRHDLGEVEDKLRYVAVKPTASVAALRQKIWYLLDLPDYCDEIIMLKSGEKELPLTQLRVGNDPQNPFLLEVWMPDNQSSTSFHKNMLTMGESITGDGKSYTDKQDNKERTTTFMDKTNTNPTKSVDKIPLRHANEKRPNSFQYSDFKKSDLGSKISSTSVFKLYRKKSRDSFTNILLKIQSDLSTLSTKLSNLENRIPPS